MFYVQYLTKKTKEWRTIAGPFRTSHEAWEWTANLTIAQHFNLRVVFIPKK